MEHYKLYSDLTTRKVYLESWGASTKHPDVVNCLDDDRDNGKFVWGFFSSDVDNIIQWLLYVASTRTFTFHAVELAQWAIGMYDN